MLTQVVCHSECYDFVKCSRLLFARIALPPMVLLLVDRPVWIVLIYSVAGAVFMPFLAATLLYLNNRCVWLRDLTNGWLINLLLVAALVLFGYLCATELAEWP